MALDSRNNNTSVYSFGGPSSSVHPHQADPCDDEDLLSSKLGLHRLTEDMTSYRYLKLHQQGHMIQGDHGKVLSDSNDGSLISFEDIYEVGAGGHAVGYEHNSITRHVDRFGNSLLSARSLELDNHILAGDSREHLKRKLSSNNKEALDWYYSSGDQTAVQKHPTTMGDSCMPPNKKQCTTTATAKKSKTKQPVASKDPQSIAAKNRRERISERLKTLQELVPNGTKVDLVTMLEKAIGYVKFLQLQVKVLAADEFWPVQGGKAPELSQVKDAIDAILSSQRSDRNSTSD